MLLGGQLLISWYSAAQPLSDRNHLPEDQMTNTTDTHLSLSTALVNSETAAYLITVESETAIWIC